MSISKYPSIVFLPSVKKPYPTIIEFLINRFPNIDKKIWEQRIIDGKILDENGEQISFSTEYTPGKKLNYFREVPEEPIIPYKEMILSENKNYMIVDKPHFLPVIPSGSFVNETLLNRLKESTGKDNLTPVNRIDMDTAGLVMISCNSDTRGLYSSLFKERSIKKVYEAITENNSPPKFSEYTVKNRLVKGEPWFRMKKGEGEVNSITKIYPVKMNERYVHFRLEPVTGKKHQLRVHLSDMGYQIINDRYYPDLMEKKDTDYNKPLQLLAKELSFIDPLTGEEKKYKSSLSLQKNW